MQSPATCSFNGQTIAHDASLTAYQVNSVAYGEECSSETRNCSNGTLGGTYSNSSCSVASAASCSFGGQTVTHGAAYWIICPIQWHVVNLILLRQEAVLTEPSADRMEIRTVQLEQLPAVVLMVKQ